MAIDWTAAGTAIGGILAGVGGVLAYHQRKASTARQEPKIVPLNGTKCDSHTDMCVRLAVLPELAEGFKDFRSEQHDFMVRMDSVMSEAFGILRRHERSIGRLEGAAGAQVADDDTKGHERIRG